jgi:hypothetical protein
VFTACFLAASHLPGSQWVVDTLKSKAKCVFFSTAVIVVVGSVNVAVTEVAYFFKVCCDTSSQDTEFSFSLPRYKLPQPIINIMVNLMFC